MKKVLKKILIALAVVASLPVICLVAVVAFCVVTTLAFNLIYAVPDMPTVKKGEFPFEITYEQNGKLVEIKDVYVCEYEGVYTTEGGKFRSWKEYFKSGNEAALTVFKDETTEVYISIGDSWYYMADPDHYKANTEIKPSARRITHKDGWISSNTLSEEELYLEYGVKIIKWKLSEPVENTFVPRWYDIRRLWE